jgi:hypothetical protein
MVNENCQNGHSVDGNGVRIFAFKWANQSKIKAKVSGQLHHGILILWKENDLVLRQKTTAQKLTADRDLKLATFPWLNNITAEGTQILIK